MSTASKLICRDCAITIKARGGFFVEMGKLVTKVRWTCNGPVVTKTIVKIHEVGRLALPDFQTDSTAIVTKIKHGISIRANIQMSGTKQTPETDQTQMVNWFSTRLPR